MLVCLKFKANGLSIERFTYKPSELYLLRRINRLVKLGMIDFEEKKANEKKLVLSQFQHVWSWFPQLTTEELMFLVNSCWEGRGAAAISILLCAKYQRELFDEQSAKAAKGRYENDFDRAFKVFGALFGGVEGAKEEVWEEWGSYSVLMQALKMRARSYIAMVRGLQERPLKRERELLPKDCMETKNMFLGEGLKAHYSPLLEEYLDAYADHLCKAIEESNNAWYFSVNLGILVIEANLDGAIQGDCGEGAREVCIHRGQGADQEP